MWYFLALLDVPRDCVINVFSISGLGQYLNMIIWMRTLTKSVVLVMIIQTDKPSQFISAYKIGKSTLKVIWQNIFLAFGVKVIVLILGATGMAILWEAVFADVGVGVVAHYECDEIAKDEVVK